LLIELAEGSKQSTGTAALLSAELINLNRAKQRCDEPPVDCHHQWAIFQLPHQQLASGANSK